MPSLLNPGSSSRTTGRRGLLDSSNEELAERLALLQQEAAEFGAPQPEIDKPGFLFRAIDSLSAFNFALSGFTEELARGGIGSLPTAVGRATREFYSSARSLPFGQVLPEIEGAQKKNFAQVFKGMGFGTTTLADVFPALEGSFLGELVNTRGTIGLGTDVLADPLTYFSFGLSAVARRTMTRFAKQGIKKGANKKGLRKLTEIERGIRKERGVLGKQVDEALDDDIRVEATKRFLDLGDESLFDPGGAKFAGLAIPGTAGIGKAAVDRLSAPLVSALNRFGIGRRVVRSADNLDGAVTAMLRETFGAFGPLEALPDAQKAAAIGTARKWTEASAWLDARLGERVKNSGFIQYFRANPKRIEPVMDMMQLKRVRPVSGLEAAAVEELSGFLGEIAQQGVEIGLFPKAVLENPSYIFSRYTNDMDDLPEVWAGLTGKSAGVSNKHARQKVFDTMKQGEEVSGRLEKVSKAARSLGIPVPLYRKLKPDYNLENGLARYVGWFSKQHALRGLAADMRGQFGFDEPSWQKVVTALYDVADDVLDIDSPEFSRVVGFFDSKKTLAKLSLSRAEELGVKGKRLGRRIAGWDDIAKTGTKLLRGLSRDGKRQFFKEMFSRVSTDAQLADVLKSFDKEFGEFFPNQLVDFDGEFEDALRLFGDQAEYTRVGGNSIWGKGNALVPQLIVEYVNKANSRILNTKDFEGFRAMMKSWHRVNNFFKTAVYPLFPSSAFRDKMSNMFLSSLRIGWHAIDPGLHSHSMAVLSKHNAGPLRRAGDALSESLGGGFTSRGGRFYSHDEAVQLARTHNVPITGRQWAEVTGDGKYQITNTTPIRQLVKEGDLSTVARRPLDKALELRAKLDNEDRFALFIQGLQDGLTPEEAAADVAEFLYNYNELGAIHRDLVRSLIPFSTFTVKNIRLQLRALRTQPGVVINQLKPFRGRSDENDMLTKFEAEGLKLRVNQNGTIRALTGIDLPLRNLDTIWAGGVGATGRRFLGMMSPIIKAPIEQATGRDLFSGRMLTRTQIPAVGRLLDNEFVPRAMKQYFGLVKRTDDAGRVTYEADALRVQLWVKSYVFSRAVSVSDRQFREYLGDRQVARSMMDVFTGLRLKDLNMDDQKRRLLFQRIRATEEVLGRVGRRRTFVKQFTPKDTGVFP